MCPTYKYRSPTATTHFFGRTKRATAHTQTHRYRTLRVTHTTTPELFSAYARHVMTTHLDVSSAGAHGEDGEVLRGLQPAENEGPEDGGEWAPSRAKHETGATE